MHLKMGNLEKKGTGFDDMVCVREEEVRGRRARRGDLWQGGAEISQSRGEKV